MTLTFETATCLLFAHVMVNLCAKLVIYLIILDKVMGQTRRGFTEAYAQNLNADCKFDI